MTLRTPALAVVLGSLCLMAMPLASAGHPPVSTAKKSHAKPSGKHSIKSTPVAPPSFAQDQAVIDFALDLEKRHGFAAQSLLDDFAQVHPNPTVLKLIKPPASPAQRSWERYRARFLNDRRIDGGVAFFTQNRVTLERASRDYGVPPEIITAIIGVETEYGRNTGGFKVLEALTTLAFHYPPRAEFFRTELEQFLLLARENHLSPLAIKGSFAGAIGIPQFMPGSQRRFAVDFDGNAQVDLSNSVEDAIGSVGRFLEQHGWQAGQEVTRPLPAEWELNPAWLEAGVRPSLRAGEILGPHKPAELDSELRVAVIDLTTPEKATEYWLGLENFYVITRYNRSSFYAMSVYQLAQAIREKTTSAVGRP